MDGELPTASELAALLPNWYCSSPSGAPIDYTGLKAAAIVMADAPEEDQRSLIEAYSRAYCEPDLAFGFCGHGVVTVRRDANQPPPPEADRHKAAGMFLLLRVLFVLPAHYPSADARGFTWWIQKWPAGGAAALKASTETDLAWPVHEVAGGRVLLVDHFDGPGYYMGPPLPYYRALAEYDWFAAHFPRRTAEQIEALEIKPADDSRTPAADALGMQ